MNKQTLINYAIGPVASMLLGFVSIPLITWHFSPEAIATNALMVTSVALLGFLMTLALETYYLRHYEQEDHDELLFFCGAISLFFLTFSLVLFYLISPVTVSEWFLGSHSLAIEWLVIVTCYAVTSIKFLLCVLRMNDKSFEYSLSQGLNKGMLVILIGVAILAGLTQKQWLIVCTLITQIVMVSYLFWIVTKHTEQKLTVCFPLNKAKTALLFSLPLMVNGVAMWAMSSIDRFMLNSLSTQFELALYSVAFNFATAATIVYAVFSAAWAPHIFKMIEGDNHNIEEYQRVLRHILHIVIALASLYGLFSWIVVLILPNEYAAVQYILVGCSLVPLITALAGISTVAIQVTKKTSKIAFCAGISLIINILLNQWLIPQYGAVGATIGSGGAVVVYFIAVSQAAKSEGANLNLTHAYCATFILLLAGAVVALEVAPNWLATTIWLLPLIYVMQQNWTLIRNGVKRGYATLTRSYSL
ncbi:oligosaccharide flippase family protein [Vibrio sp. SM6]|uniref:Oligosaccharide flippase family protein n=1 Tax=Vibrio agarilyticus TaxID=2726741 RepID=A0A7X8TPK9_9VIBR|nr:oligosaccharide flippase family protein [Vibrio agarilyticus]NLS12486.1 oligosaccharide flippase family protein [Vibrio agarilyticus]